MKTFHVTYMVEVERVATVAARDAEEAQEVVEQGDYDDAHVLGIIVESETGERTITEVNEARLMDKTLYEQWEQQVRNDAINASIEGSDTDAVDITEDGTIFLGLRQVSAKRQFQSWSYYQLIHNRVDD